MNISLRSIFIELVLGKTDSFLAECALETHCFVLGGNEFRLRVLVCDAKRSDTVLSMLCKLIYVCVVKKIIMLTLVC